MLDLSKTEFPEKELSDVIVNNDFVVVLFFKAAWCGSCRSWQPKLTEFFQNFSRDHLPVEFVVIDISHTKTEKFGIDYNISTLPTLVFLGEGVEFSRLYGTIDNSVLQSTIMNYWEEDCNADAE